MKRYKELLFESKIYTETYKIDEILIKNKFNWFLDCEVENVRLEIMKGHLIFNSGVFFDGSWIYGVFRDGQWKNGSWEGGVWYNGTWYNGKFKSGLIFNGRFRNGEITGGEIRGGEFYDIKISEDVIRTDQKKEEIPIETQKIEPQKIEEKLKHLKSYNESIFGDISRSIKPGRYENDTKLYNLFKEMEKDFNEYGRDLMKVKIMNDKEEKLTSSRFKLGDSARLTYIFGKYHPTNNNIHTSNTRVGNRKIGISYVPFSFVFKKNSLEKMFHTNRINPLRITVKDTKVEDNLEYNPNIRRNNMFDDPTPSDREKMVKFHEKEEDYRVSSDTAGDILKYFIDEYNKQYPGLDKHMGPMDINDIKRGVEPTLRYINFITKDGKSESYDLRRGDNEIEMKKLLSSMTEDEYKKWWRKHTDEIYKPHSDKIEKERIYLTDKMSKHFSDLLKNNGIIIKEKGSKYDKYDINLVGVPYTYVRISFTVDNMDIKTLEDKIKSIPKDFENYKFKDFHVDKSYSYGRDGDKDIYVTILLEKEED